MRAQGWEQAPASRLSLALQRFSDLNGSNLEEFRAELAGSDRARGAAEEFAAEGQEQGQEREGDDWDEGEEGEDRERDNAADSRKQCGSALSGGRADGGDDNGGVEVEVKKLEPVSPEQQSSYSNAEKLPAWVDFLVVVSNEGGLSNKVVIESAGE